MRGEPVPEEMQDGAELFNLLAGPIRPTLAEYLDLPHAVVTDMNTIERTMRELARAK